MSILAVDPTTMPAGAGVTALPAPAPVDNSPWTLWVFVAWSILGILIAFRLGAFRRRSIIGPPRLSDNNSAWDLTVILFLAYLVGIIAGLTVAAMVRVDQSVKQFILGATINGGMLCTILLVLAYQRPGWIQRLGLQSRRVGTGIVGGAVTICVLFPLIQITSGLVEFLFHRFHWTDAKPHQVLQILGDTRNHWMTVFGVTLAVVIAPVTEEIFYRGLLQTIFVCAFSWVSDVGNRRSVVASPANDSSVSLQTIDQSKSVPAAVWPRWAGVILTSIIFAGVHIEPAFLLPIFVLAVGLGYVYERTGNLWVTITAHALFNTAQIVFYLAGMH